jgi:hypothetical protein
MQLRHAASLICAVALVSCSESTSPTPQSSVLTDAPDLGGTLTIAGVSGLSSVNVNAISSAVIGTPWALVAAGSRTMPTPPTCTFGANGMSVCSMTVNGLTIAMTSAGRDSIGLRTETQMTGTIAAAAGRPELRINRRAVIWMQPMIGGSNAFISLRHRSNENGTHEQMSTPRVVSTDTGSVDIRMVLNVDNTASSSIPRMVGTSRRVIWTSRGDAPATFWRETTTYDSSTVIRSEIETPTGTRRCSIDMAARVIALTCS